MRNLALGVVVAGATLAIGSRSLDLTKTQPEPQAVAVASRVTSAVPTATHAVATAATSTVAPATLTEVVQRYCVVCHNDQMRTGNVSMQTFDVERANENPQIAERMIRKLRAGMMPPPGMPRPSPDTLQALVETLEARVDEAARANPNLGARRFQRLSRNEYERVVFDLLGLKVNSGKWLPPDVMMASFDNMAPSQTLSTTMLDSFLRAAADVSRLAVGDASAENISTKYANPVEVSQHAWDHVDGTPFGTRGGMVATHHFPADGEYVLSFETDLGGGNQTSMEDLVVTIDGEIVATVMLQNNNAGGGGGFGGQGAGPSGPAPRTAPIFVKAGQRSVSASFVNLIEGTYDDRLQPNAWSWSGTQGNDYGITGLTHLTALMVTGPQKVAGVTETESRQRVFTCHPSKTSEQRACAQQITRNLVERAYRRPATDDDVADLMTLYDESAPQEGFEVGVRTVLQGVLASPEFVFRFEREPEGVQAGQVFPLADIDLAGRLSFFLWATGPDAELIELAEKKQLSKPEVLEQQVQRMLKDPRSKALSQRFVHQWLRLQDVGKVWPEKYMYPNFSKQLAESMVKETQMLFQHLVDNDKSLIELFNARYTFVNEILAEHYGIPGVAGDEMRMVQYPTDERRGIFGHGSIMQLTSMADRTSPTLRGKWVMVVIMGTPPPPPPPNVPVFAASAPAAEGRLLTTRERMERHRAAPVCNSCHRFMDPIGLALDNLDVTGKWRIREHMQPLDTRGQYFDGTNISTPAELSDVLLKRPIPLVRNFTNQLMAYAIGRPTDYHDQPLVRQIVNAAEPGGYKVSDLIVGVVKSPVFQMRQAQTTAN